MDEDNRLIKLNKDYQWQPPFDVCAGYFDALDNCWQVRHNFFGQHWPQPVPPGWSLATASAPGWFAVSTIRLASRSTVGKAGTRIRRWPM